MGSGGEEEVTHPGESSAPSVLPDEKAAGPVEGYDADARLWQDPSNGLLLDVSEPIRQVSNDVSEDGVYDAISSNPAVADEESKEPSGNDLLSEDRVSVNQHVVESDSAERDNSASIAVRGYLAEHIVNAANTSRKEVGEPRQSERDGDLSKLVQIMDEMKKASLSVDSHASCPNSEVSADGNRKIESAVLTELTAGSNEGSENEVGESALEKKPEGVRGSSDGLKDESSVTDESNPSENHEVAETEDASERGMDESVLERESKAAEGSSDGLGDESLVTEDSNPAKPNAEIAQTKDVSERGVDDSALERESKAAEGSSDGLGDESLVTEDSNPAKPNAEIAQTKDVSERGVDESALDRESEVARGPAEGLGDESLATDESNPAKPDAKVAQTKDASESAVGESALKMVLEENVLETLSKATRESSGLLHRPLINFDPQTAVDQVKSEEAGRTPGTKIGEETDEICKAAAAVEPNKVMTRSMQELRKKGEVFLVRGPATEFVQFGVSAADDYFVENDSAESNELEETGSNSKKSPDIAPELKPGVVWDRRFRVMAKLGSGGMATVYKATHIQMSITVALKIMHHDMTAGGGTARFMREARLLSAVNHPNVVRLQAYGSTKDSVHFMALEFINGRPLSQVLAEDTMEPARAVLIAIQVCRGLQAAHEAGIVHRDLKPSNIIIALDDKEDEIVKVIDFGIARLADDLEETAGRITRTSSILGTPNYMSPEQCMGKRADYRSDIYSLGCLLYEMLCGHPPFIADQPYLVLTAHIHDAVKVLPSTIPVPKSLQEVVLKCLEKKPSARYASALALAEELADTNWNTTRITTTKGVEPSRLEKFNGYIATVIVLCLLAAVGMVTHSDTAKQAADAMKTGHRQIMGLTLEPRDTMVHRLPYPAQRIEIYRRWIKEKDNPAKPDPDAYFFLAEDLRAANGMTLEANEEFRRASAIYKHQLEVEESSSTPSPAGVIQHCLRLSECTRQTEGWPKAEQLLKECVERWKQKLSKARLSTLYCELSELATGQAQYERAEEYAAQSESLLESEGLIVELSRSKLLRARALFKLKRRNAAMVLLATADHDHDKNRAFKDPSWDQSVAFQYLQMEAFDEALIKFDQSLKSHEVPVLINSYVGKAEALKRLDRFTEARDCLLALMKDVGNLPDADVQKWEALGHLARIAQSRRTEVDLAQSTDDLLKIFKNTRTDHLTLSAMAAAAREILSAHDKASATKIVNRAVGLFSGSILTGDKLLEQDLTTGNLLLEVLLQTGQFEQAGALASKMYDTTAPPLQLGAVLHTQSLHAMADSYRWKQEGSMKAETRQEIIARSKRVDGWLADKHPGELRELEAFLDRAVIQKNLKRDYEQWLKWSVDLVQGHPNLLLPAYDLVTSRIFLALCNKDNLLADELFESGLTMYEAPAAVGLYKTAAGTQYFCAQRYDRAVDIWLPVLDSDVMLREMPLCYQRSLFLDCIYACEHSGGHARLAELKRRVPPLAH